MELLTNDADEQGIGKLIATITANGDLASVRGVGPALARHRRLNHDLPVPEPHDRAVERVGRAERNPLAVAGLGGSKGATAWEAPIQPAADGHPLSGEFPVMRVQIPDGERRRCGESQRREGKDGDHAGFRIVKRRRT